MEGIGGWWFPGPNVFCFDFAFHCVCVCLFVCTPLLPQAFFAHIGVLLCVMLFGPKSCVSFRCGCAPTCSFIYVFVCVYVIAILFIMMFVWSSASRFVLFVGVHFLAYM